MSGQKSGTGSHAMISSDTIAAISSAVGPAARMIVRLSGSRSLLIAGELGAPADRGGRSAIRCDLAFCDLTVPAWVYLFESPRSYTGEDLVEFHLPGNPALATMLVRELLRRGARPAGAGEFTARAYFNGRMDLATAEGVAAAVSAQSERELFAARQLMGGELARRLKPIVERIADTLALIEVGIDFSEEDVSFLPAEQLKDRIGGADDALSQLLLEHVRFERLSHHPTLVLVGRPNAGKSTLLNALAGHERAVVSPVPGTTRDALSAEVVLKRGIVTVVDVAGFDEHELAAGDDEIALHMRRRAIEYATAADVLVLVEDCTNQAPPIPLPRPPNLTVRSKLDLATTGTPFRHDRADASVGIDVSAKTGIGMDSLKQMLDVLCFGDEATGGTLALNVRHVAAVNDAAASLERAAAGVGAAPAEVLALELRDALDSLGSILGRITPDEVLGRIFAAFCIGK